MVSHKTEVSANKLYTAAIAKGLNKNSGIAKSSHNDNSVFNYKSYSTSSNSSLNTLAMVAGAAGIATSIFSIAKACSGSSNSAPGGFSLSGAQSGSSAVSAKSTIATLDNAGTSNNAEAIKKAITQGQTDSGKLGGQISQAQEQVSTLEDGVEKIQSDYDNLGAQNDDLKSQLPDGKSSTELIGDESKLEADLATTPETIDDGNGVQQPNPAYKEIQEKIETTKQKIKQAEDIEKQIKENEDKMTQLQQDKKTKENELNNAKTKVESLTNDQKSIDAKVAQLQKILTDTQNSTKTDTETTKADNASGKTATPTQTIDEVVKEGLSGYDSNVKSQENLSKYMFETKIQVAKDEGDTKTLDNIKTEVNTSKLGDSDKKELLDLLSN